MQSLILTLGHNSSAILVEDGNIICGYENERLTGIKSDSQFPALAILEINNYYPMDNPDIYISHWFLDGLLPENDKKHLDTDFIKSHFPRSNLFSLTPRRFTHHDAHMLSAEVFAGDTFPEDHHTLVIDGFGTHGECISLYHNRHLMKRITGFHNSVGLMYQYATDFCGLKMHQDEYKLLGYESHITEVYPDLTKLNRYIDYVTDFFDMSITLDYAEKSLDVLSYIKDKVNQQLIRFLADNTEPHHREFEKRVLVSYFVQRHLESIVCGIIQAFQPKNLILAGGTFYNVKLNHLISKYVDNICVMPLAGDQGAGLGVYEYYNGDLKWPGHVFWGKRDFTYSEENKTDEIVKALNFHGVVNLIHGPMEFGPRALGHTSTLAVPTPYFTNLINSMNNRSTIMPMGLIVTEDQAKYLFEDIDKVHKSLEYMIITREFKPNKHLGLEGGALHYPQTDTWTCRPQITKDPMLVGILERFGPLINTSANYHGQPIVCTIDQIKYMIEKQIEFYPITTIISED